MALNNNDDDDDDGNDSNNNVSLTGRSIDVVECTASVFVVAGADGYGC